MIVLDGNKNLKEQIMSENAGTTVGEGAKPAWAAQLSDDLKGNETLTRFQSISDLGKAFLDADGKLKNAVTLPREGASDQEQAEFFSKLGRPESPDKYQLERPKLPEGMQYNEDKEKKYRSAAHGAGITDKQLKTLYGLFINDQISDYQAMMKQRDDDVKSAETALKTEWGDKYGENVELAFRAVIALGGQKLNDELSRLPIGNNPELVKVFAMLGAKLAPDKLVTGEKGGSSETKATGQFVYDKSPGMYKKES